MLPGIRGTLVSHGYSTRRLALDFGGRLGEATRSDAHRAFADWWRREGAALGPASGIGRVIAAGAVPLLRVLGLEAAGPRAVPDGDCAVVAFRAPGLGVPLVATLWGCGLDGLMGRASAAGSASGASWAMGFNGSHLRLWDTARGWSRAHLDFEIGTLLDHPDSFHVFWAVARADALRSVTRLIAGASDRHGVAVRDSLRDGVREALEVLIAGLAGQRALARRDSTRRAAAMFQEALTVVYRLLFLLFAESRGLVPIWHPLYRRSYSVESLRRSAERPGRHPGLWASVRAISRLAYSGCHAGDLVVSPFNGRLFAPHRAPIIETARLDDDSAAKAVLAITTAPGVDGRERIAFADLGVEQLGAVYESVLDYEPLVVATRVTGEPRDGQPGRRSVRLAGTGLRRKASGTFYTPREVTDYVVRRALEPLTTDRSPDAILELRVLDPAMGSGAFLVAACRFLAAAYERAVVRDRGWMPGDITEDDRAGFRRLVAQRCLYGVDINPMAVQVARLSLWLATLAAGKPLGFLDHRLAVGNSLVGAAPDDVAQRPPGGPRRTRRPRPLPLFPEEEHASDLQRTLSLRHQFASVPDDTAAVVRDKERAFGASRARGAGLSGWRNLADVWCAGWFWDADAGPRPTAGEFADVAAAARGRRSMLPPASVRRRLQHVQRLARQHGFFHWEAEFPEVFHGADGRRREDAGFDAVVTNPPWETVRADTGSAECRAFDRAGRGRLLRFARDAGVYRVCQDGHANLYQLFVERCLRLTRRGGRVGLIVPWGLASDHGCRQLRRYLLERCDTDVIVGFENTNAVFPIHRGVRFALVSTSPGRPTQATRAIVGLRDPAVLERLGAGTDDPGPGGVRLTPEILARVSGSDLAVPYTSEARDLAILERLRGAHPPLGSPEGWGLAFGRELNATEDRHLLSPGGPGLPVVEGRHLEPFRVRVEAPGKTVRSADRLPGDALRSAVGRWRLAYRDVASATNRLTLIAALVPPGHVTVHTVFCLKTPLGLRTQAYLCAILNSFVANFLVRMWVTTHVTTRILARLPVPALGAGSAEFESLAGLALAVRDGDGERDGRYAAAQACAARAYGLDAGEFARVLDSFPLVDPALRSRCLALL